MDGVVIRSNMVYFVSWGCDTFSGGEVGRGWRWGRGVPSLVKIPWYLLLSSGNENMGIVSGRHNLPISNPKPDLHNINAHTKFGENPLMFTQVIIRTWKLGVSQENNSLKFDEICPLALPNQISTILMHIPSLVKIHWQLLKLSSEMKYTWTDVQLTDRRTDERHTDVQRETITPRHYYVAGIKRRLL